MTKQRRRRSPISIELTQCQQLEERALLSAVADPSGGSADFSYFESREELGEYLINQALERHSHRFGQPEWPWDSRVFYPAHGGVLRVSLEDSLGRATSNTYNQVEGVDERDIIENDGEHLYLLRGGNLVVIDATPAGEMEVVSSIELDGHALGMYLHDSQLTVISSSYPSFHYDRISIGIPIEWEPETVVTTWDVSDPSEPTVVQQTTIEGDYRDSRAIDGRVHVVTSRRVALPLPRTIPIEDDSEPTATTTDRKAGSSDVAISLIWAPRDPTHVYESRESYEAWLRAEIDSLIDEALPEYEMNLADGTSAGGFLSDFDEIAVFEDADCANLTSVLTIDPATTDPGLAGSTSLFSHTGMTTYATADHLYLSRIEYSDQVRTRIVQFGWATGDANAQLISAGFVRGSLLNQFAMDEYDGRLRVATTTRDRSGFSNNVYVLEAMDSKLTVVGSLEGFGEDETIRSVRFSGDRAFVVTFELIDPLFMVDLSDPTSPAITGELEVPGFSTHLHRIGDYLLAIGRIGNSTKATVYDIGDPTNPTLVDEDVLPKGTSTSAHGDPRAFGWYPEHSLLTLPTYRHGESALVGFTIDLDAEGEDVITQRGTIKETGVVRSAYIGDVLYTVGRDSVVATSIDDFSTVLGRVDGLGNGTQKPQLPIPRIRFHRNGWRPLLAQIGQRLRGEKVRINLPQQPSVDVALRGNTLVVKSDAGDETYELPERTHLELAGTAADDHLRVDLSEAASRSLASFSVRTQAGDDTIGVVGLNEELPYSELFGGAGHDTITIDTPIAHRQKLFGGPGNDVLRGGFGHDLIDGGAGNDLITGGAGNDRLVGRDGNDRIRGLDGSDTISGGGADDRLFGGRGNDVIRGGRGNDRLRGSNGADSLEGNSGDDQVHGDAGDDTLLDVAQGTLADLFSGGRGRDRFVADNAGQEVIDRLFDFRQEEDWLFDLQA